jgi:hypothetical protein
MNTSVTGIAAMATGLAQAKDADAINIAVLKKALDSQNSMAIGLINAIPPAPVTSSIGHTINTTA